MATAVTLGWGEMLALNAPGVAVMVGAFVGLLAVPAVLPHVIVRVATLWMRYREFRSTTAS